MVDPIYRYRLRGAWVILVLNILDLISTYTAIALGAHEGNPVVAPLVHTGLAIPVKLAIGLVILYSAWSDRNPTLRSLCAVWWVVGLYSLVVALNLLQIVRLL